VTAGRPDEAVRAYSSPLRDRQAAETRRRVLEAAAVCFGEHGYAGTTLRDIARAASVSLDTVRAQGAKTSLFLAAFDLALVGEDQALPLREQPAPQLREAFAARTLEDLLPALCAFLAESNRRSAKLWWAFAGAATSESDLAQAYTAKMDVMRAEGISNLRWMISNGMLDAPANLQELADELWLIAHVAQYHLLVTQAGWSQKRYLSWLNDRVAATVAPLRPSSEQRQRPRRPQRPTPSGPISSLPGTRRS